MTKIEVTKCGFSRTKAAFAVVRALRQAGYEVDVVSEICSGADDRDIANLSFRLKAILLVEDKDFGQLIFAESQQAIGVISLRYPNFIRLRIAEAVVNLVRQRGDDLIGKFVVIQPGSIRITPLPKPQ